MSSSLAYNMLLLLLTMLHVVLARPPHHEYEATGGCLGLGECCPGRNLSCSSTGQRADNKDDTATCFCDEECVTIGDCCLDYRAACPARDCLLADAWKPWSECDVRCGYGVQVRVRDIVAEPVNGGQACGETVQRRMCEGQHCKLPRSHHGAVSQLKETAAIVPASYATWRTDALYSPFEDIRQNLFTHLKYAQFTRQHREPSYCAKFEVTETRSACSGHEWTSRLTVGTIVCVECQQFVTVSSRRSGRRCAGHGVYERQTAWNALGVRRCHGKWTLISRHVKPCQCDTRADTSFVFV